MTSAVSILPDQQLAVFNDAYRKAVARKRLRMTLATAVFCAATSNTKFNRLVWFADNATPVNVRVWKPGNIARTVYVPGCMAAKV